MKVLPKYRTIWQRLAATILDLLIVVFPLVIAKLVYEAAFYAADAPKTPLLFSQRFAEEALPIIYSFFMLARYGQTLGMRVAKVKLFDISEGKIRLRQVLLHESVMMSLGVLSFMVDAPVVWSGTTMPSDLLNLPDILGVAFIVASVITLLANRKRRSLSDYIAGSVVLRLEPEVHAPRLRPATAKEQFKID